MLTHHKDVDGSAPSNRRRLDVARLTHAIALAAAAIVLGALAVDNRRAVRIGWVFGAGDAPLWVLIISAVIAGSAVGALLTLRTRSR